MEDKIYLHENANHGKPGFGMVAYKNDFSTYINHSIPWHWHEEIEFVVVTQGTVMFSAAGDNFALKEGEGIFLNANSLHRMDPANGKNAYMFSVLIHGGMLSAKQGYLLHAEYVEPYLQDSTLPYKILRLHNEKDLQILYDLKRFQDIFFEEQPGYEYSLFSLGSQLWNACIHHFWKEKPAIQHKTDADQQRIYQAMEFIQNHYAEALSLNDICRAASISRSECCRCFQRNLKMSPFAYLASFRITRAAELLQTTDDSLTEIAISTGFNDDSYFCKIFKNYIGCTPLAYRKGMMKINGNEDTHRNG